MDTTNVQPKANRSPIQVGEYLPWKGFMFQITEVTKTGFTVEVKGVTKKLRHLAEPDAEQKRTEVVRA